MNRECRSLKKAQTSYAQRNSSCSALKRRLAQIEFAINDLVLYLDSYPGCAEAIGYYNTLVEEYNNTIDVINQQCGPMTIFENGDNERWTWIDGPWPWNIDAN